MGKVQEGAPTPNSPQSEASKLLEAALQQMDGIISGVGGETKATLEAAERLACAIKEPPLPPPPPDPSTAAVLRNWLRQSSTDSDELVRRLEGDKERLALQVSVLTEQIDAQAEKIIDLEKALEDRKKQMHTAEDVFNREMLARSSLETQKLELLSLVSDLKRQQATLERENLELRDRLADERRRNKPPIIPRTCTASTTNQVTSRGVSPSSSSPAVVSSRKVMEHQDDINLLHQSSLPGFKRAGELQYSSLPRQTSHPMPTANPDIPKKGVAFADTDTVVIDDTVSETDTRSHTPQPTLSQSNKTKVIQKIFGKIKRSGSGNLDDLPSDSEFRRGGVRATAGGRLGWSISPQYAGQEQPFSEWTCVQVGEWLKEMGLGLECAYEAKRWGKTGAQILAATPSEVDKELAIKNPLHRKKLHLALVSLRGTCGDTYLVPSGSLDTEWVLRWLDDVGLPQHKEAFLTARIDGRMLHRLTMEDLAALHVTSVLHAASIRTGIQVLRSKNFNGSCLIRRPSPEGDVHNEQEVAFWTNHRVMEWLRSVDLAEYAPNLRGSGVHGGLMVHEPRFTGELMASLLSIPPSKTLLRRHLLTHFKDLLGRDVIQVKRETEASVGYIPLTSTAKLKVPKKSQFTLKRKKSKSELDYGELVCPLEISRGEDTSGDGWSAGKTQRQEDASLEKGDSWNFSTKIGTLIFERSTNV